MSGLTASAILKEMERLAKEKVSTPKGSLGEVLHKLNQSDAGQAVDILTYIEAGWGLDEKPYPVQRFMLKLIYGLPLDYEKKNIDIWDKFHEQILATFTEAEFLEFLNEQDRCNLTLEKHNARLGKKINLVVFRIGRRGGKCVDEHTLCHTSKGLLSLKELSDLGSFNVSDGKGGWKLCTQVYDNGVQETLKIITSLGLTLDGLPDHRVWVMGEDGLHTWRYLRDLKLGDYVCCSHHNENSFGESKPYSLEQFELWGIYVGDGCVTESFKSSIAIQVESFEERDLVESLMKRVLGRIPFWVPDKRQGKRTGRLVVGAFGRGVSRDGCLRDEWLRLGFGYDVKKTGVPLLIRTASKEQQAAFLRGLFESDGTTSGPRKLSFCAKSKILASHVQLMLLSWGIVSNCRKKIVKGEEYWNVDIHSNRDRKLFVEEIGFLSSRKQQASVIASSSSRETDYIPYQKDRLWSLYRELKPFGSHKDPAKSLFSARLNSDNTEHLTKQKLERILALFPQSTETRSHFEALIKDNYYYTQVVSIEKSSCYTRDLVVPEGHVYVASGMVTHNTTISQWVAAYELYQLTRIYSPQEYYHSRKDQPVRITLVATSEDQARELLSPARAAIQRSPILKQYVTSDSQDRITLNTQANIDRGVSSASGIKVAAAACSARSLRGPSNILALLEEYGFFNSELRSANSNKSDKEIFKALTPSTGDFVNPVTAHQDSVVIIVSTPQTKLSHMYQIEDGIRKGEIEGLVLWLPTYWINPTIQSQKYHQDHVLDPIGFHQEYDAEYLDNVESAFSSTAVQRCRKDPDGYYNTILPGETTWMGMDLGLKNDGTSIFVVASKGGSNRVIFKQTIRMGKPGYEDFLSFSETGEELDFLDIKKVAEHIEKTFNYYGCQAGLYDQWNCVLPSTLITIKDGFQKRVDSLKIGDLVLTHEGRYRPIKEVFSGKVNDLLYTLKLEGIPGSLSATHQHRFLVLDKEKNSWGWKYASDIRKGDFLQTKPIQEELYQSDISDEHCELMGWFLAEGFYTDYKQKLIGFVLNAEEEKIVGDHLTDLMQRLFPPELNQQLKKDKLVNRTLNTNGCVSYKYNNAAAYQFFSENAPYQEQPSLRRKPAAFKSLHSRWLTLPLHQQRILMNAFWKGDGYVNSSRNGTIVTGLASSYLVDQLQQICHRLGGFTWIRHTYSTKPIDPELARSATLKSTQYTQLLHWLGMGWGAAGKILNNNFVGLKSRGSRSYYYTQPGVLVRKVTDVKVTPYEGDVYDLHVDQDFSYLTNGVVSHNSFGLMSHLSSRLRELLRPVDFNATNNDHLARHAMAMINQAKVTIYETEEDWHDPESFIWELIHLQRIQTSGPNPKIRIQASGLEGRHDDQYSAFSRAIWAAKVGTEDQVVSTHAPPTPAAKRIVNSLRAKAEQLRRQQAYNNPRVIPPNLRRFR